MKYYSFLSICASKAISIHFVVLLLAYLVSAESQTVTVTAEPPVSISPSTEAPGADNEITPGSETAIESLDFRLRYVEQVQMIFSRNIKELKNRIKVMEDTLTEHNITINSPEV